MPILLCAVEACPVLAHDKSSFNFSITRLFMKLFSTGSALFVKECQVYFNFLPLNFEIDLRTTSFLEQYIRSENSVCLLFNMQAQSHLLTIYSSYGDNVRSLDELRLDINKRFFC